MAQKTNPRALQRGVCIVTVAWEWTGDLRRPRRQLAWLLPRESDLRL